MKIAAIVLAAGQGTRMKSNLPKVLHPLAGQPMIQYVIDAVHTVINEPPVVVVGYGAELVKQAVGSGVRYALQDKQLGTAHAVKTVRPLLEGHADLVLVLNGDMPLLTPATIEKLIVAQRGNKGTITMLTVIAEDPRGFGRVLRGSDGMVQAIIEEAHATPEQLKVRELNVSAYCITANWLWTTLDRIQVSPKGEYYLTDLVALSNAEGLPVQALVIENPTEAVGINNRIHLAEADALMRQRINASLMLSGVTLIDPDSTYIGPGVQIGRDTTIMPNTYLRGKTVIGENCVIGPNTIIEDTQVGNECTILASVLEGSIVEDNVSMGPFCHLRKGAHLGKGVHLGNFGEVKDSYLAPGVKMGHFSYIGNATIGENVNIGAGTITCNYDGVRKNSTEIGANAFIGSDTMLVAPVKIGEGSKTGAGAVVTRDVPPGTVVVGVPARPLRKENSG